MNTDLLKDFIEGITQKNLNVRGIVVRQHGTVIASHDFVPPERIHLFSASKSITSIGVGIAMSEGYFNLDDKFVDLLADILPSKLPDGFEKITVRHLLTMTTGHSECPIFKKQRINCEEVEKRGEKVEVPGTGSKGDKDDGWFSSFFSEQLTYEPGTVFAYNNSASYMLSVIVQKKTGLSLLEYLKPRMFDPLGITDPVWMTDPNGYCLGAIGLHLTTEELSRAGQLLLNGGKWEGTQIIPASYVEMMTAKQTETIWKDQNIPLGIPLGAFAEGSQGYGFHIWLCTYPKAYRMDGMLGQFSIGIPTLDAVVAITSQQMGDTSPILQLVWDAVVPKLENAK